MTADATEEVHHLTPYAEAVIAAAACLETIVRCSVWSAHARTEIARKRDQFFSLPATHPGERARALRTPLRRLHTTKHVRNGVDFGD